MFAAFVDPDGNPIEPGGADPGLPAPDDQQPIDQPPSDRLDQSFIDRVTGRAPPREPRPGTSQPQPLLQPRDLRPVLPPPNARPEPRVQESRPNQ